MKKIKITALIIFLFIGFTISYGHDNISGLKMVQKIDSIAESKNIHYGRVQILFVTNTFDLTETEIKKITNVSKFTFDDQFLVIENKYFNINKLIFFYMKNEIIEFYFQGY